MVAGADMDDDLDCLLPSWGHQEVDLEGDPVRVDGPPGSEQRQNHQIVESARYRLTLVVERGWGLYIMMKEVVRDDGVVLEADGHRGFGDVDQDPVGNGLLSGIRINDIPTVISRHSSHLPAFDQATARFCFGKLR